MREVISLVEFEDRVVSLASEEFAILKNAFLKRIDVTQLPDQKYLLSAKNFVGNIVLPNHVIIIQPKIPNINFFRMLFFTSELVPEFDHNEIGYEREEDIYEIIVRRFLEEVERIVKQGLSKDYVEIEANLPSVKQRILIHENIRRNIVLKQRIYCRFSDLTNEVPENKIIKLTLFRLLHVPVRDTHLLHKAKHLIQYFEHILLQEIGPGQFPSVVYNRLNENYETAINLSKLLLSNSTLNLQNRGMIEFSSFLVDMNTLFQKFLFSYLRDNLDGWTVKSEPTYAIDSEREIISHPDIVIRKGGKDALVIDAKYKQPRVGDQGINSDVYQIHTYSVGLRVPVGILVYPKHETLLAFKERHSIDRTQILIWTIDLSKPRLEFVRECDYFVSRVSDLLRNRIIGEFLAR